MTLLRFALASVLLLGSAALRADDYADQQARWHKARLDALTAPDGWLSLIGLHWLELGDNTVGSASGNTVRLLAGPASLGTVRLSPDGTVHYQPDDAAAVLIDQLPARPMELNYLPGLRPTLVSSGTVSFQVIQRGPRIGLRVRDSDAATRRQFAGIPLYPLDPAWRIEADWQSYPEPRAVEITNSIGQKLPARLVGRAVFTHAGQTVELAAIAEGDELFFVFGDATNGEETYAACRFLYAAKPQNGKVILDFNRAINPPCAFTAFATCPLPPAGNRLPFPVRAGEMTPAGGPKH